jgi:hypothetical protein
MPDLTARIFDLIRAIKNYSYIGQMPIQEVDDKRSSGKGVSKTARPLPV